MIRRYSKAITDGLQICILQIKKKDTCFISLKIKCPLHPIHKNYSSRQLGMSPRLKVALQTEFFFKILYSMENVQ